MELIKLQPVWNRFMKRKAIDLVENSSIRGDIEEDNFSDEI